MTWVYVWPECMTWVYVWPECLYIWPERWVRHTTERCAAGRRTSFSDDISPSFSSASSRPWSRVAFPWSHFSMLQVLVAGCMCLCVCVSVWGRDTCYVSVCVLQKSCGVPNDFQAIREQLLTSMEWSPLDPFLTVVDIEHIYIWTVHVSFLGGIDKRSENMLKWMRNNT